jgi:hypothetical protein
MKEGILSLLMMAAMPTEGAAQDTLKTENSEVTVGVELMTRGELRNGGMPTDSDDPTSEDKSAFIIDRERIKIGFQRDWLSLKATAQHVGTWGAEGGATTTIFEAWAKVTAKNGLFTQIGRQALVYDDERIIGSDDWVVMPMTHDALRLGYEGHGHKAHGILAYNQNLRAVDEAGSFYTNGSAPYKTMQTVWYHYDVPKFPLGASLLFMNIGMQAGSIGGTQSERPRTEWQQVYGGYLKFEPKHFCFEGSYYRQGGHDERGIKLDAWMYALKGQWMPNDRWSVQTGYDHLSGDDTVILVEEGGLGLIRHDVIKGFNPVYGAHHTFYGAMDFFYITTFVNGFTPGLQNAYIGGTYSPVKGLSLSTTYHYFATGTQLNGYNKETKRNELLDKSLGHEIELEADYEITKDVMVAAGFSYMTGTDLMKRLKRTSADGNLRWAWITLNITPTIFSTKW